MDQQTLERIIESGKPVPITSGLMLAVADKAHLQRSKALSDGVRRLRHAIHSTISKSTNYRP